MSVKTKIVSIFLGLVIFPTVLAFGVVLKVFSNHITNLTTNATKQYLAANNFALDLKSSNYNNLTMQFYYNEDLMRILSSPVLESEDEKVLQETLNSIVNSENHLATVCIQTNQKTILAGKNLLGLTEFQQEHQQQILDAKGKLFWIPTQNFADSYGHQNQLFCMARTIRSQNIPLATIWLYVREDFFSSSYDSRNFYPETISAVVEKSDTSHSFVYASIENSQTTLVSTIPYILQAEGYFYTQIGQEEYLVVYSQLSTSKWYNIIATPKRLLLQGREQIQLVAILAFASFLFFLLVTLVVMSHSVFTPLQKLSTKMKQVSKGEFDTKMPVAQNDEIGQLGNKFNEMVDEIDLLVERVKHEAAQKNDAKMTALSMQISPHFMFNTLGSIKWMAVINQQENIEKATDALIQLLRHVSKESGDTVLLAQEIEFLDKYCYIQKIRFMNFEVEYQIPPETQNCLIPKLILQPIVENSIIHGVSKMPCNGKITIRAQQQNNTLLITVEDNGKGFNTTMQPTSLERPPAGIGIENVRERIALECGPDYGLTIVSAPEQGTTATITLPFAQENAYD